MSGEAVVRHRQCPCVYPPSAEGPYSDETGVGWSGPLRCVMSEGHEGDRHWNTGISWRDSALAAPDARASS